MFKNYFKTAWRNLSFNKNYTIINVAGLSIGIAVCMIIFIIIQFQSSFNNFHSKKDRIYRVLTEYHHKDSKDIFYGRGVPFAMPDGLRKEFPQFQKVAKIMVDHNDQVTVLSSTSEQNKKFREENGIFYTEPSFFNIFDFPLLEGSYESLKDPNNALVTTAAAEKYFGDSKSAIGKTIRLNDNATIKISGILANIPANTDFQFKVVVAFGTGFTSRFVNSTNWDGTNSAFGCYVLFDSDNSVASFDKQLRAYSKKVRSPDDQDSQVIQPLSDVHFDTRVNDYSGRPVSRDLIKALWLIAAFILLIACVNFINLSTAQAVNRAKEVGVRKVLGSNKWQLKAQFIIETYLIVNTSVFLAVMIAIGALPYVNQVLELSLSINLFANPSLIVMLLVMSVGVTLLAGFYPSVVLSRFNPINALKSKLVAKSSKGISLRRGLVVFQFIIAQSLIIGTLIVIKQMNYFNTQPLGFNKDAIVNIPYHNDSISVSKLDYLKKQISAINGIQNFSFSSSTPIEDDNDNWSLFNFNRAIKETDFYAITKFVDNEYLPTYQLPLAAGRNMISSDTAKEFLVNEILVKNIGLKDPHDAIGKEISIWGGQLKGRIAGVLKDFNARSFRRDLAPVILTSYKKEYSQAGIKLSTKDLTSTMESIKRIWDKTFPDYVFEYKFLDEKIESFYKEEKQLSQLYKIFAGLAIFLSCLGLYGLASFMAVQRIKEVGIRKVLGATAMNIVYLFSREFILLITIAFVIATPIAWYYMHQWLQNYPFQTKISWWIFIIGGIASLMIALITVSFQAIKAAIANPVKSLRTE